MIMESIFNTGLVNPSKDETVRIRKQLEKFGSVADANVFYWFQNRRSRSRRRQRQIKALMANNPQIPSGVSATGAIPYEHTSPLSVGSFASSSSSPWVMAPSSCEAFDNNSGNNHFSVSQQMGSQEMEQMPMVSSIILPSNNANLHYQSGSCLWANIRIPLNFGFSKYNQIFFYDNIYGQLCFSLSKRFFLKHTCFIHLDFVI